MAQTLVIVESPAKAKTIEKLLPKGCKVVASMGHIIDLPSSKLGVDVENNYAPQYITIKGKAKLLNEIKKEAKASSEVILATDPDREGEAISYHLANSLSLSLQDNNRIEFHEITEPAIKSAMENKRKVDINLVNAQQARRVLDRLVGYKISPVLWKKIMSGLSAGRVQSVATRLIVDREKEIEAFVAEEYWNISAMLTKRGHKTVFEAKLAKFDNKKAEFSCEAETKEAVEELNTCEYTVGEIKKSKKSKKPMPPYTTSTLQQDANKKLNYTSKKTMMLAQMLYEGVDIEGRGHAGLVTYIRTDSTRISDVAKDAASEYIQSVYGKKYLASSGVRKTKASAAKVQDAHEAIRPTDVNLTPAEAAKSLTRDQARLYELIYKRFIASMMADSVFDTVSATIECGRCELKANGSHLVFDGYLKVYGTKDEEDSEELPEFATKEVLALKEVKNEQKFTSPPARYTEASLVKALEERGIGRPSTYAPTIATIQGRNYVELKEKKFFPTLIGSAVTKLLCDNFKDLMDYDFTAEMETELDNVESGKADWIKVVDGFYKELMVDVEKSGDIGKVELEIDEVCEVCGKPMVIKSGRFGKFLACSGYPECKNTRQLGQSAKDASAEIDEGLKNQVCEKCGKEMVVKVGRFGKFLACSGYPECKNTKPIETKIDAVCPKCGSEIVMRKSKKGRTFYGCKAYPSCDFVSWDKPVNEKCPECGKTMVEAFIKGEAVIKCPDKECGYKKAKE